MQRTRPVSLRSALPTLERLASRVRQLEPAWEDLQDEEGLTISTIIVRNLPTVSVLKLFS